MTVFRTLGLGTVIFDYSGASELSYRALDCSRDNLLTLPFPPFPPALYRTFGWLRARKPNLRRSSQIPVDTLPAHLCE